MTRKEKHDWEGIAVAGFLAALLAWILYHAFGGSTTQGGNSSSPSYNLGGVTVPPIVQPSPGTLVPLTLDPWPVLPNNNGGCCCNGCAAGTTSDPTVDQINNIGSAALTQMQQNANATFQALVNLSNSYDPGEVKFVISGG